jgi:hypothetical protein
MRSCRPRQSSDVTRWLMPLSGSGLSLGLQLHRPGRAVRLADCRSLLVGRWHRDCTGRSCMPVHARKGRAGPGSAGKDISRSGQSEPSGSESRAPWRFIDEGRPALRVPTGRLTVRGAFVSRSVAPWLTGSVQHATVAAATCGTRARHARLKAEVGVRLFGLAPDSAG